MGKEKEERAITLSEFVHKTIAEIADGLGSVQEKYRDKGVQINPYSYENRRTLMEIKFDVAITTTAEETQDGGMKIKVFCLDFGMNKSDKINASALSHVQFSVPVNYVVYNSNCPIAPDMRRITEDTYQC